jgi:hypothetical protein
MTEEVEESSPILIPTPIEVEAGLATKSRPRQSDDASGDSIIDAEYLDKHRIHISDEIVDTKSSFEEK